MKRYWQIYLHLVWGTENRRHVIRGPLELRLHEALRAATRELELVPVCINSAWNHTHSLISWNPTHSVDSVVEHLKTASIEAIGDKDQTPAFRWQQGYAAFSVSPGQVKRIKKYILTQKELHRTGKTKWDFESWMNL